MTAARFNSAEAEGITIAASEDDADRAKAFLGAFGLGPTESRVFLDRSGHPIALSPAMVAGLDRYAAIELGQAARAIAEPTEIRELWKPGADGRQQLTRRYIAETDELDVVVDVNRAGWRFKTSRDSGFRLDELRTGTVVWPTA